MRYTFADIEIDTETLELRQAGVIHPVEPLTLDVLCVLIENRHCVMSKDDLVREVWRDRVISDSTISSSIKAARHAIGDDGKNQRLIRTMNRRGYRFVGEVTGRNESSSDVLTVVETTESIKEKAQVDSPSPVTNERPSIAVLPFEMRNNFDRFPVLSEAVAHDISRSLSRLRWLRVIATASAFKCRGVESTIEGAARVLGARYCLTGSAEIRNSNLLLAVELIDSRDMNIVWSESYEGSVNDVDSLRSDVTAKTIVMVEQQIPVNEATIARLQSPADLDAWASFYLGLVNVNRFTPESTGTSIRLFEQAIKLEPRFARAHAALSFAHFQQAFNQYPDVDVSLSGKLAASNAERSLELDEFDPFCNFVYGRVSWLSGQVEQSFNWLDRAIQINPNFAQGFYARALAAVLTGTEHDVHGASDRAIALSPLDPMMYGFQGIRAFEYLAAQDYDAAKKWADKSAHSPGELVVMELVAVAANELAGDADAAK
ncbi:MAG: winged helix-turn-helix domain-containing tetratricopeptide repeat protein, partial [Granulosicoccus sp.]